MIWVFALIIAVLGAMIMYHRPQPALSSARRRLLIVLRTVAIFILLAYLFKPILHFIKRGENAPIVVFLKDNSRSMELLHRGKAKGEAMAEGVDELMAKYKEAGYETVQYDFADGIKGSRDNSLLGKSLLTLAGEKDFARVQKIVLASDGWLKDADFAFVQKLDKPIIALADSAQEKSRDLEMVSLKADRYAYRKENTIIRAELLAHEYSGEAKVRLKTGGKILQEQTLSLKEGELKGLDFVHSFDQLGFYPFTVEVLPLGDEKRLGNNSLPGAIEVLKEKERIAVFSDAPAWDNMFVLDAIAANPRWEKSSYQVREGRVYQGMREANLANAPDPAVIVIINNGALRVNAPLQQYLRTNLERKAGLLYLGMPLPEIAEYLPLLSSNIQSSYQGFVRLESRASGYPMLDPLLAEVSKLPPLDYFYLNPASDARVLASMNNPQKSPAIAILEKDARRSLALSFLNLWRWQLNSPDAGYQKMMINMLTWLSNEALGSFSAIYKTGWLQGEEIEVLLRSEDDIRSRNLDSQPVIRVFDTRDRQVFEDFLTEKGEEYAISFSLDEPGEYSFEITDQKSGKKDVGRFFIEKESVESRDYDYNLSLLYYLANSSGGELLTLEDVAIYAPLSAQKEEYISTKEFELYKKWYILSVFVLVFCVELFLRRRWGLL